MNDDRFIARELGQVRCRASGILRHGQALAGHHESADSRRADQEITSIHRCPPYAECLVAPPFAGLLDPEISHT
ncbi:hypothetical protein D3C72_2319010 [compost metagenome]